MTVQIDISGYDNAVLKTSGLNEGAGTGRKKVESI